MLRGFSDLNKKNNILLGILWLMTEVRAFGFYKEPPFIVQTTATPMHSQTTVMYL